MRSSLTGAINLKRYGTALLATAFAAGCGGGKTAAVVPGPSATIGLPAPVAPGPVNTYSGAQSPGEWQLTLDDSKGAFSYQLVTFPASPTGGSTQVTAAFLNLGPAGLALELPGRAAMLRPGDGTAAPVFAVPQAQCYEMTGKLRFEYIGMFAGSLPAEIGSAGPVLGYGSIVASTDTSGASWSFENLQGNIVSGPAAFPGTCSAANGQASIIPTGPAILNDSWAPFAGSQTVTALPKSGTSAFWIGPSGFFAADQSDPSQTSPSGASVAGVAEPASPLITAKVAAAQYLGFLYEAPAFAYSFNVGPATAETAPVSFGQVASSGTVMTGGIFPSDDVTGTPNADIQIDLGKQDGTINGLYKAVSITVLDPAQNCANFTDYSIPVTTGVNANGYLTCTFPGVAVVGNPEGKYAIFITTYNWAARLSGVPMQIYLFQSQS